MKKEIPLPVTVAIVAVVVLLVGVVLYRGANSGIQGDGKTGNVEASPPIPKHAQEQMMNGNSAAKK